MQNTLNVDLLNANGGLGLVPGPRLPQGRVTNKQSDDELRRPRTWDVGDLVLVAVSRSWHVDFPRSLAQSRLASSAGSCSLGNGETSSSTARRPCATRVSLVVVCRCPGVVCRALGARRDDGLVYDLSSGESTR